jgi:glycosyltransferase involved in cell wall biosynthesis
LRKADELAVCESEAGRVELVSRGYPAAAVRVAPNGVDPQVYRSDPEARARIRAEWGATADELIIGAVGRLNHQKGFDVLVQAASQLKQGGRPWRLVIAGEGPEMPMLRDLAVKLNVKVSFLGRVEDMPSALSGFDVYVQSSRFEGLSNALLEAMATGLPCVATSVDGTLDFGHDGENLLLVAPEDAPALAAGLDRLLENAALRAKLAENATITARQRSVGQMVRAFEEAYDAAATHSF